jgi:hypothetical protein
MKKIKTTKKEKYEKPLAVKFPRPGEEKKIAEFWTEHD